MANQREKRGPTLGIPLSNFRCQGVPNWLYMDHNKQAEVRRTPIILPRFTTTNPVPRLQTARMTPSTTIPAVDMGSWRAGSATDRKRIALEIAGACRRVGFVYVTNHGVPADLLDEAFVWSRRLFDLPLEKKMLAPHPPGTGRLFVTHRPKDSRLG